MSTFLAVRYVAFAVFIMFSGLAGSFAALNLGFMSSGVVTSQTVEALAIFLVALSVVNVVFVIPVVGTELYRRGALTSRIWFELFWISGFFLAYLGGAIAATLLVPTAVCQTGGSMKLACMASMALIAFTWTSSVAYLIYFFALLAYCIIHSKPNFSIWNTSVVDHPWAPKPVPISRGQTPSIDSRRTLTDAQAHPFNMKVYYPQDDSSILEKDNVLPVYAQAAILRGPPAFGTGHGAGRRGGFDIGTANAKSVHGQPMGVNAVNGAPAYYAQQQDTYFSAPGPHKFYQSPRGDVESQSNTVGLTSHGSIVPVPGSRQAPWPNNEETPSPAVITHASRVPQPSMSLYPAHVVNAGLTIQSAKPAKQPGAMNDLLRAAGLNQSATSLPYLNSVSGHSRQSDGASIVSREGEHSKSQSMESMIQSYARPNERAGSRSGGRRSTSEGREQKRGRSSRPRHRPPPLDLSKLSNIKNANKR